MNGAQLLGPLVGGAIYQAGGFYLPFVTMGSLQVLVGLISIFCLHEPNYGSKFIYVLPTLTFVTLPIFNFVSYERVAFKR